MVGISKLSWKGCKGGFKTTQKTWLVNFKWVYSGIPKMGWNPEGDEQIPLLLLRVLWKYRGWNGLDRVRKI